jgi:hypothetical protein
MKIKITESHYNKIMSALNESYEFDDAEYIELGVFSFRTWIREKYGEVIVNNPLTYLMNKYGDEFTKDLGINGEEDNEVEPVDEYYSAIRFFEVVGRAMVAKKIKELPSLAPEQKFTEKHKRALDIMLKTIHVSDFYTVDIVEDTPNNLEFIFKIDGLKALKSPHKVNKDYSYEISNEIENYITNVMGYREGNPVHGDVEISHETITSDISDWIKTEWNKVIKPKIKSLPLVSRYVKAIRASDKKYNSIFDIQLIFHGVVRFNEKSNVIDDVKELITNLGYNTENLTVSR